MTIRLTAEQEARFAEIAAQAGRPIDDLARKAVDLYLEEGTHSRTAVQEGIDAALQKALLIGSLALPAAPSLPTAPV